MRISRSRRAGVAVAAAGLMLVSACGGDGGSTSGGGGGGSEGGDLPEVINFVSIQPQTGPAAFAGLSAEDGFKLAIKEINEQGFLGDNTTIEVEYKDTRGQIPTAASELSTAIANQSVSAVYGSVSSQEAVAQSPLAQQAGLPIIYTQAGSEGVIVGDATYRMTPLMSSYYPVLQDYVDENGWETVGVVYASTPTLEEVATKSLEGLGLEVVASVNAQLTTQDYTPAIRQILAADPDVVSLLLVGASNPTAMTQLRQAGYDGPVLGNLGASAGNLSPAGEDGAGMVWATDFHPAQDIESTQAFVEAYEEEYGETPLNYAAEGYDAAWFLARAIKEAGSADRAAIVEAMGTISSQPWTGALGEGLSFEDNTIQVPGAAVEWTGTEGKLLYYADGS
ncbi:ABC transporter substrate-binding protein [Blastococcus sp. PRF04-17]|uniref:ABC transporter substrate-binding protein n=1 Tax=Blastococcus sp. PRF04-17 TaxID=2933797 RepID=UPI001FF3F7AB|nr:ABC transporter substrate-binding protein [Blastococcus sp. PRF04-17]UOY01771.1 ABC transporter substrate-binding protein [Blastococcus sp. PRF04-17]